MRSAYQNQIIAIQDVATYSFSLFDDGSFGFWAAGKAGWFEVTKPAKSFKKIFEEMQEATSMFYFLADKCGSARNNMTHCSVKAQNDYIKYLFSEVGLSSNVCFPTDGSQYLNSNNCRRDDIDDVREGFHQHREFLIKSMLEGQEGLDWESSPIFRHFKRTFRVRKSYREARRWLISDLGRLQDTQRYCENCTDRTNRGAHPFSNTKEHWKESTGE